MTTDKLIFSRTQKARKRSGSTTVRLSDEAFDLLCDWERATGHSLTYLASAMITFADAHAVLEDGSEEVDAE